MYNEHSLATALTRAGLKNPTRRDFQEGKCPDLDQLDNRPDDTLFVEAYG
jgi:hypothetical protein